MIRFGDILASVNREIDMYQLRNQVRSGLNLPGVPGEGKWRSPKLMIIHERPGGGYMQGIFRKRAAAVYREILEREKIGLSEIYVTACVKTRPGTKRPSLRYEMNLWGPVLDREIGLVKPQAVVLLGHLARRMAKHSKELNKYGSTGISTAKEEAGRI